MLTFVRKCHEAGVVIVAGSHTMMNVEPGGFSQQREIEFLVEGVSRPLADAGAYLAAARSDELHRVMTRSNMAVRAAPAGRASAS